MILDSIETLNAFVDSGMADLSRAELAVWLIFLPQHQTGRDRPSIARRPGSARRNRSTNGKSSGRPARLVARCSRLSDAAESTADLRRIVPSRFLWSEHPTVGTDAYSTVGILLAGTVAAHGYHPRSTPFGGVTRSCTRLALFGRFNVALRWKLWCQSQIRFDTGAINVQSLSKAVFRGSCQRSGGNRLIDRIVSRKGERSCLSISGSKTIARYATSKCLRWKRAA